MENHVVVRLPFPATGRDPPKSFVLTGPSTDGCHFRLARTLVLAASSREPAAGCVKDGAAPSGRWYPGSVWLLDPPFQARSRRARPTQRHPAQTRQAPNLRV